MPRFAIPATAPTAVAALTALALLAPAARAQTYYWPPEFSIDHVACVGNAAEIELTVHGVWFCSAIPTGARFFPGNVAYFVAVEWDYAVPPPCAAVLTPWRYTLTIRGNDFDRAIPVVAIFEGPLALSAAGMGSFVADCCPADRDDGTNSGHPDGGVTIDDLLYYLTLFERGTPAADIDDGSGGGTRDGGVTIDDLLYYLARFEAGC